MRATADDHKTEEPVDTPFRHRRRAFFSRLLLAASAAWLLPTAVKGILRRRERREKAQDGRPVSVHINPLAVPREPEDSTLNG